MPAKTKDKATAGPAWTPAAFPVRTKMPVPITTPTPNTVRSSALSRLRSWCSGSSVSAMDCSIVLVRQRFTSITSSPGARTAAPLRVHRDTDGAYPGEPENTHRVRGSEDRFPSRRSRCACRAAASEEGEMARWRRGVREFYQVQLRLWAQYGRRYELSGLETRAMLPPAPLHWAG